MEDLAGFRLKAFAISKGQSCLMSEVIPRAFESGEDVVDVKTGKNGQVRFADWVCATESWRYCISRKDIDDPTAWISEARLKRAPAQTRIDSKGKPIKYAPRRLKHQQKPSPYFQRDKTSPKSNYFEGYRCRPLVP